MVRRLAVRRMEVLTFASNDLCLPSEAAQERLMFPKELATPQIHDHTEG